MIKLSNIKFFLFLILVISLLFSCGGKGKAIRTVEGDPEILYKEGLIRFNKRDYSEALKKFEQLKSSFPDSPPFTTLAELKIGDCQFHMKEYVEAISAYEEFKKIHPTHEDIPYVQFQIAISYFNQMVSHDRDQTFTKKALSNFEYLINNYPTSIFAEKAKPKIEICKNRLIEHEFYIGNYYYKKGKLEAAAKRFEGILKMFPGRNDGDKILFFLGKSYIELGRYDLAREKFKRILDEYPNSVYYKEAKLLIEDATSKEKLPLQKSKHAKKEKQLLKKGSEEFFIPKYEEERRRPVDFYEGSFKIAEKSMPESPDNEVSNISMEPKKEDRIQVAYQYNKVFTESLEINAYDERRVHSLSEYVVKKKEIEEPEKEKEDVKRVKEKDFKDSNYPIEIVSDKVETFSKENLIIFRGNVKARQKDIIIYANSIEAFIGKDGKGIEKIVASGDVKIQQALHIANCEKAEFYNLEQKVILTGNPKIMEGENIVSGKEIIFYIEKDEIEVRGGTKERVKVKIRVEGKTFEEKIK